jgi:hypothetical protein
MRIGRRRRRRLTETGETTVIVNHWYSHAVGHVIEALRRCQGYHACDPGLRLNLVLNAATPVELARCAPFIDTVYAVPYTSFGAPDGSPWRALRGIPRDWDHVLHHPCTTDPNEARYEGLRRYYDASRHHFRARISVGVAGKSPPAFAPHQELRLVLPEPVQARARVELNGRRSIAIMPAGSGTRALYPSVTSWTLVLDQLERRFPDAVFSFVGRLRSGKGRTVSGITRAEVDRLLDSRGHALDVFDRPILEQLAVVQASSLFVSPHTGFGYAAVSVGTPWLTLSGGDWHEALFNGVPFYSVIPRSREYPVFVRGQAMPMIQADEDGEGARARVMSARRIREDIDELVEAAEILIDGRLSYEAALSGYFPRLLEAYRGDMSMVGTFEDAQRGHL